jgi:hypothetical protein
MKKNLSFTLILSFSNFVLFSQTVAFEKGQIIKKNNDTINCLVELTPTYESIVNYKINSDSKPQKIKIKEVKSLKTPFNTFENITVNKAQLLFRIVVNGNITLLEYSKINISSSKDNVLGGKMVYYGAPTIINAIRTNENCFIIKQKKDLNLITYLLNNCPDAKAIVDNKLFKLDELKTVVSKLNKCN